jgi:hypothetical protein
VFDAWHPPDDPDEQVLREVADRVAGQALRTPRAVVGFETRVTDVAADGSVGVALVATAVGSSSIAFGLDPAASGVILAVDGSSRRVAMPRPDTGFVTADATAVGGRGSDALLDRGVTAALTFRVVEAEGASTVALEVAGSLSEAMPDELPSAAFVVRTPEAPIPR